MPLLLERRWALIAFSLVLGACATPQPPVAGDSSAAAAAAPTPSARGPEVATAPPSSVAGTAGEATSRRAAPRDMSVYFEFDSSALSDAGQRIVQQQAEFLGARQPVRLEGNADERGSREYNIALGQRRADAVRQMLVLRGMPSERVDAVSYGEERPRCGEQSGTCFASNRRVDFVYSASGR